MASADSPPTSALPPPSTEQDPANMTYFLPGNPPPHLAPSITHQPETLLMQTLLDSLTTVVTQILNHPMIDGPAPDHHLFTDVDAYRLYFQYHSSVVELARNTMRLKRASRLLQFIPGPRATLADTASTLLHNSHPILQISWLTKFAPSARLAATAGPVSILRLAVALPETVHAPETAQHRSLSHYTVYHHIAVSRLTYFSLP